MRKKLSLLLVFAMVLSLLPVTALADANADPLIEVLGADYLTKMTETDDSKLSHAYVKQTAAAGTTDGDVHHVTITLTKTSTVREAAVVGTPAQGVGLQGIQGKFKAKWIPAFIPTPVSGYDVKYGQFSGEYTIWQDVTGDHLADSNATREQDWFQAGYEGYYLAEYTKKSDSSKVRVCYDVKFADGWLEADAPAITAETTDDKTIKATVTGTATGTSLKVYYAKDKTFEANSGADISNDGIATFSDLEPGTYTLLLVNTTGVSGGDVLGELICSTEVTLPAPSKVATLSALKYKISDGEAVDVTEFNSDTYSYDVELPADTAADAQITLEGTLSDSKANITSNSGVKLSSGSGSATITVTAEDPTVTKTYTVKFSTATGNESHDATLKNLSYKVGEDTAVPVTGFTSEKEEYEVILPAGTADGTVITLECEVTDTDKATISKTPATLADGMGTATVTVTAEDKTTTRTYTVTFKTEGTKSNIATLKALTYTVGKGTAVAVPGFASDKDSYDVELPSDTAADAEISLGGTLTDVKAEITDNKGVTLTAGKGKATITVTAEDGTPHTYTVNFTTAPKPVYTIKFAAGTGATGTMEAKTVDKAASGATTYELPKSTFAAPAGKVFDKWTVEGEGLTLDGTTLTIADTVATTADITVTATWKDAPPVTTQNYTIKFAAGEGATGTIADKTVDKADTGATTVALPVGEAFTFTAPEGKVFDKWTVGVEGITVSENGETLTIDSNVPTTAAIVVTATWKALGTTVAAPEVDTSGLTGVSDDDIKEVTESASTVETKTETGTDPLADALNQQTEDVEGLKKSVTDDQKEAAVDELKELLGDEVTSKEDVVPVVVSYMNIKVKEYEPGSGKLAMEIEPQLMVVLTSAAMAEKVNNNTDTIKTSGDGKNAVKTNANPKEAKITVPVVVQVKLPASFVEFVGNRKVYAGHQKGGRRFEYRGKHGNNGAFSFTNPHGFSPFDFTVDPSSGAWIGDVGYETLSSALEEVKNGDTIYVTGNDETGTTSRKDLTDASFSIRKAESAESTTFTPWKGTVTINGTKYTTDANDTITVTKPDDSKPGSSTSGGGGGGGGSSKPAIKKGDQPEKPTTPTTTPGGGVAGFNDVATSAWYADSVKYVVDKGLFGGVGNGNFAPNANMTRAMMWTVLARYMGVNTNTGSSWYEAARTWAMAQNISDGTMADGNVTREQFVTMLWRLSGEPAVETSASFTDNGRISGYAKTAVDWAVAQGILNGYNDGSFRPQGSATRAEVAKMLTVFCQNAENTETPENSED